MSELWSAETRGSASLGYTHCGFVSAGFGTSSDETVDQIRSLKLGCGGCGLWMIRLGGDGAEDTDLFRRVIAMGWQIEPARCPLCH